MRQVHNEIGTYLCTYCCTYISHFLTDDYFDVNMNRFNLIQHHLYFTYVHTYVRTDVHTYVVVFHLDESAVGALFDEDPVAHNERINSQIKERDDPLMAIRYT